MDALSFGSFCLVPDERLLTKNGVPVALGARTLDTLIVLISRLGETVSKSELMATVWPDAVVGEASLRFHVAALRKALADGENGARYIVTLPSRGYRFVAPVFRSSPGAASTPKFARSMDLPRGLERMVGRRNEIALLTDQLSRYRFVSIAGSGGVGKTTIAVALAHELVPEFGGSVIFLDLGLIDDPTLVPITLASTLGVSVQSDDPTPNIVTYLREKRFLLVLDNCEHIIEAAAVLVEHLLQGAPHLHILATSREPLAVEGEYVYRLQPLALPPDEPALSVDAALSFPATQLFIDRARANGAPIELQEEDVATIAHICRKLDGVPLAIELAASRVVAYGLERTAELLDERLALLWRGARTAPPRQRTMQAAIDWSFHLLSEAERAVLRRLAIFVGYFTLKAALFVIVGDEIDEEVAIRAIESLVAKSMLVVQPSKPMRYRLLHTTRAHALNAVAFGQRPRELSERHARYCCKALERLGDITKHSTPLSTAGVDEINDVRAALEWCFSPGGSLETGVSLAAAAAPIFLHFSLLTECHRWLERALAVNQGYLGSPGQEMRLHAALGLSLMLTRGNDETALASLHKGVFIAEREGDSVGQVELLGLLHMYHHRIGEFALGMDVAKRSSAVARLSGDPASLTLSSGISGISLLRLGDLYGAKSALEAALDHTPGSQMGRSIFPRFDPYIWLGIPLAKTLWLQGYPRQAMDRARFTIEEAARVNRPVTLALALKGTLPVFLWSGDHTKAEDYISRLISHATYHSLGPYISVGNGFRAELLLRQGEPERGVRMLKDAIEELGRARYALHTTSFQIALAQGLGLLGRVDDALRVISEAALSVERNGDLSFMPELLRVKGNLIQRASPSSADAEVCLKEALAMSQRQGALAWELRASVDLAELWLSKDAQEMARSVLEAILPRFEQAASTADLESARTLLATINALA